MVEREAETVRGGAGRGGRARLWWAVLLIILVAFVVLALWGLDEDSRTADERKYLNAGETLLDSFRFDATVTIQHPPLTYYVHGLLNKVVGFTEQDYDARLYWSRILMLIFPLICAVVLFVWTRELFGGLAAAGATLLLCFDPSFIGHGRLVTTDVPVTALFLAAMWGYRRLLLRGGANRVLVSGILTGLALLTKYSAVLLVPTMCLILLLGLLLSRRTGISGWRPVVNTVLALMVALLVVHVAYGFTGSLVSMGDLDFQSTAFRTLVKLPVVKSLPAPLPCPYMLGLDYQLGYSRYGAPCFLAGTLHRGGGVWYYFLLGLLIKQPVGTLVLVALAVLVMAVWRRVTSAELLFLVIPPVFVLTYCSFFNRSNAGFRYVMPAVPFLVIWTGAVFAQSASKRPRWLPFVAAPLVLWCVVSCVMVSPHYLSYFNEIIGGPKQGWRWAAGSDTDWGQDRERAIRYVREMMTKGRPVRDPDLLPSTGLSLVGVTNLQDCLTPRYTREWLRRFQPSEYLGYSYLVFDLTLEDFRRLLAQNPDDPEACYALAGALFWEGRTAEADRTLTDLLKAHPDHPRGLYLKALILWRGRRDEEAVRELDRAITSDPDFVVAHCTKAMMLLLMRRPAEADRAFQDELWHEMILSHAGDEVPLNARFYEDVIRAGHAESWHHNNLALIYWHDGHLDRAEAEARRAVELDNLLLRARSTLAWILWKQDRLSEAVAAMQSLYRLGGQVSAHQVPSICGGRGRVVYGNPLHIRREALIGIFADERLKQGSNLTAVAERLVSTNEGYLALRLFLDARPVDEAEARTLAALRQRVLVMNHLLR